MGYKQTRYWVKSLGNSLDFTICDECGALVHDDNQHTAWHNRLDRIFRWAGDRGYVKPPEVETVIEKGASSG